MLGAISGYSSFFSPVSYYSKPAGGLENPVAPVVPVKAEPTATAGRSTGLIAGLSLPAMREGADPVEMAVRMRIQYPEEEQDAQGASAAEEAQKALEAKATREDRKVVSQSVTYHTAICPECGKSYVSGGTTRTATKANPVEEPQQDQQSQNQTQNPNRTPFEAVA